jgi:hypothetical protein
MNIHDSLDEALMETFPGADPIAVDVIRSVSPESEVPLTVVEEWHDLLQRSRSSVSLAPRRRAAA